MPEIIERAPWLKNRCALLYEVFYLKSNPLQFGFALIFYLTLSI